MADRDTVRLLTGASDTDASDDQLDDLLTLEAGAVKLAAADLLELMAGRLQAVQSDDIAVDGAKQAATLMARAAQLRAQHYDHGGDFAFDTTTVVADYADRDWFNPSVDSDYTGCGWI